MKPNITIQRAIGAMARKQKIRDRLKKAANQGLGKGSSGSIGKGIVLPKDPKKGPKFADEEDIDLSGLKVLNLG